MNQEKIGKFIQEMRKEKNITQKELAEKLGVTDKTVSRWENGHYLPDISLFESLCSIVEIDVSELLKGERISKIDKEDVIDLTSNLVKISNDKIRRKNNKVLIIASLIIVLLAIGTVYIIKNIAKNIPPAVDEMAPGREVHFPSRMAVLEKDDGWVARFNIEYPALNSKEPHYYSYGCHNFKYKSLKGYIAKGEEEDENGKFEYDVETNHPNCIYNKEYSVDIEAISKYFEEKKFKAPIKMEDLAGLELKKVDKNELLDLYNRAITSELVTKYGNYGRYPQAGLQIERKFDKYTWYVGYLLNMGKIVYINLELKIDDEYLSDKIKNNTASQEEIEIFSNIKKIEDYVLKKQNFALNEEFMNKRPYSFLSYAFSYIKDGKMY